MIALKIIHLTANYSQQKSIYMPKVHRYIFSIFTWPKCKSQKYCLQNTRLWLVHWVTRWWILKFFLSLIIIFLHRFIAAIFDPLFSRRFLSSQPVAACCETEVWGIMATIIMQDGPFLAMRLYLLVEVRAINHMMIFFTCKNILIILLQLYRLAVIYLEQPNRAQHFMQQTYARYRGHTFRSSGGSHGEPEIRPPKKRPNNMNQSSSRKRLVTSQKDYSFTEQSEPLVKPKNERQERRPTRSMQKRPSMDTGSNKRVRNDFKPIGPKETKIPPAPAAEAKPKVVDTGNPRGRQSGRRGSNKPKNVDWKTKSNNDDLKQKNLNAPRPVGGATGQGLQPKRSPQSSPSVPRMDASSNKPIERVNFSPPEYSDIYKNKLSQRNPSSRSAKPPETLPLNFLDPSKQRKQTTGVTLASPDDW